MAGIRSNVEVESKLPVFEIVPSKDYKDYLVVRCLRDDCPSHTKTEVKPFIVHRRAFTNKRRSTFKPETVLYGRSCPYCYRPSRVR